MMTRYLAFLLLLPLALGGCATTVNIKDANGDTMSGSLTNGSMSLSHGLACVPAVPSPAAPLPQSTPAPAMQAKMVCDSQGQHCQAMMMALAADNAPTCDTTVATVRGTDTTTYFGWILAGLAAAAVAVLSGS
jgi:hypothetical protein